MLSLSRPQELRDVLGRVWLRLHRRADRAVRVYEADSDTIAFQPATAFDTLMGNIGMADSLFRDHTRHSAVVHYSDMMNHRKSAGRKQGRG